MEKKPLIGIITHHYIKNYGAFLQAYALQETLKILYPFSEVEIINYINRKHYFTKIVFVSKFIRYFHLIHKKFSCF